MAFLLSVGRREDAPLQLTLDAGDVLFILGANGTGKSSLMHRLYNQHQQLAQRISAHRQTWFASSELALSPVERRNTEHNIRSRDTNEDARYQEHYSGQRSNIALY